MYDVKWTMPTEINSVEDYVMAKCVPDPEDSHYKAWGYEQWLIKNFKQNFRSLCILFKADFQRYLFTKTIGDVNNVVDALVGKRLCRAKRIIRPFFRSTIRQDSLGVVLAESKNDALVLFPYGNNLFGPTFDSFDYDTVELLDDTFNDIESFNAMLPQDRVASGGDCEGRFIKYPAGRLDWDSCRSMGLDWCTEFDGGEEVFYVDNSYSGSIGYSDYSLNLIPAVPKKNGKGFKKGNKKDTIRISGLSDSELHRIRIVQ